MIGNRAVAQRQRDSIAGAHAVLVGEGLADDGVIAMRKGAQNRVAIGGRAQKTQPAVPAHDVDIAGAERGALALIAEFQAVKDVDGFHSGDGRDQLRHIARERGELAGAGTARGAHVEIGAQLLIEPHEHGLAKAADHDADAGHHGDGGGERADDDGGARKRSGQSASGEHSFGSEQAAHRIAGQAGDQ